MPLKSVAAFSLAVLAIVAIAFLSYSSLQDRASSAQSLTNTVEVVAQLEGVLSSVKDAETGQRGYLLTGRDTYLEPFADAKDRLAGELLELRDSLHGDPSQIQRLQSLDTLSRQKMNELNETIELRRAGQTDRAMAVVLSDRGKNLMDRIRVTVEDMLSSERRRIGTQTIAWENSATVAFGITWGGAAVLLFLTAVAALVVSRDHRARQLDSWLRSGQIGLGSVLQGDQTLDRLGMAILGYVCEYLEAQVGAMYVAEGDQFRRVAGHALPTGSEVEILRSGEGLAGQAARSNRPIWVHDVPAGYLPVGSATGRGDPNALLIAPAAFDGSVQAVIELGFFGGVDPAKLIFLERVRESIGVAVRTSKDRSRLEDLLQETQQQSEELQTREEELRVNNEELEEQGHSLRESRGQLEAQQAELEQINAQLEEQAQTLEHQRDDLAQSQQVLLQRGEDLQRANEYKSEFLANMSHELRTPLNSTLILAKLLADNKDGNLSEQQVKFAQTISSAGNDLLALINDVLDLSRIEAGKIELLAERVSMSRTLDALVKIFEPAATQKKLRFSAVAEPGTPDELETDPQRLGQILRNLVSNGLKFTEHGEVALRVFSAGPGEVSFAVRDTGVGIPVHQQDIIFEAFRQADGSIHRKYGGTGLGLSISKDLARLLGGTLTVKSAVGDGSVFTLTVPVKFTAPADSQAVAPRSSAPFLPAAGDSARPSQGGALRTGSTPAASIQAGPVQPGRTHAGAAAFDALPPPLVDDDRHSLSELSRLILVVEDDVSFASIIRDLVREMGYQCVVAHTANDGLAAARQYLPGAILLDMNLPDHSGLGVLDQLKRDPRTRHIPVHVASVADYRREALELGAVGYALKPAKREELIDAFRLLEAKLTQDLRRVLIVEDDPRQRESIGLLLSNGDVQITAVASAGEALEKLKSATFDCMVMDFNLPDFSGYDLLEKMARQEEVSFPPVIVYTGRALTGEEEQRLRRYSKSIIVKDARSPERLLDEVTLFLHQVESKLPPERQQMLKSARDRDSSLEGRRVLIVEDDVRNIFALSSVLEPKGATVEIARNGLEALDVLSRAQGAAAGAIDMVLMDIMMPEMDGFTAMREIRKRPEWKKLPIIALTAKAMKDDQEKCLSAGANDYIAKPLDVEKLLSLVRVWMPK